MNVQMVLEVPLIGTTRESSGDVVVSCGRERALCISALPVFCPLVVNAFNMPAKNSALMSGRYCSDGQRRWSCSSCSQKPSNVSMVTLCHPSKSGQAVSGGSLVSSRSKVLP